MTLRNFYPDEASQGGILALKQARYVCMLKSANHSTVLLTTALSKTKSSGNDQSRNISNCWRKNAKETASERYGVVCTTLLQLKTARPLSAASEPPHSTLFLIWIFTRAFNATTAPIQGVLLHEQPCASKCISSPECTDGVHVDRPQQKRAQRPVSTERSWLRSRRRCG